MDKAKKAKNTKNVNQIKKINDDDSLLEADNNPDEINEVNEVADFDYVVNKTYPAKPIVEPEQAPTLLWLNKQQSSTHETLTVEKPLLSGVEQMVPKRLVEQLYHLEEAESPQSCLYEQCEPENVAAKITDKIQSYQHHADWQNRLIQGDSLWVMAALLKQEKMAGQVQMIYIDPPYGIEYKGNWQVRMKAAMMQTSEGEQIAREPEQIKAFRDTWQLGIHSYLTHLRDRLIVARDLLADSGACFMQISDENVHLVRCVMDEVFGRENFMASIVLKTRSNTRAKYLSTLNDYILFYAKNTEQLKYHQLYKEKELDLQRFNLVELDNGEIVSVNSLDKVDSSLRLFAREQIQSTTGANTTTQPFEFEGRVFYPVPGCGWRGSNEYLQKLAAKNRLFVQGNTIRYKYYFHDFPAVEINNLWTEQMSEGNKCFIVQTASKVIQRCLLMTTDPGDLILDPTCGSGTSAYVAEQWGRRWIGIDTSRIALNIAKIRLMTATFPYYLLKDDHDISQGFIYKTMPRITSKTVAYDESPQEEILYDQVQEDKKRWRITAPFVVETLQTNQTTPNDGSWMTKTPAAKALAQRLLAYLKSAGIKNGFKSEQVIFTQVSRLKNRRWLHAQGFYSIAGVEKKAYFYIGSPFHTVSQSAVAQAIKACQRQGDAQWLIILGFSFAESIKNQMIAVKSPTTTRQTKNLQPINNPIENLAVTPVQMHDDLLQADLSSNDRKAAAFMSLGEPKVICHSLDESTVQLEIVNIAVYNPITHSITPRSPHDIAYWMIDEDYQGHTFQVNQLFLGGKNQKEFAQWHKELNKLARESKRKRAAQQGKIIVDETAFKRLYGYISHPITVKHHTQKIALRVISQWGEETLLIVNC